MVHQKQSIVAQFGRKYAFFWVRIITFRQRDRLILDHRGKSAPSGHDFTDLARSREFVSNPAARGTGCRERAALGKDPMAAESLLLEEYLATLTQESEEVRLLKRIPWIVGTHRQDAVHILEGLRAEASCFAELPEGPLFSLLTPLWNTPPRLLDELILSVRCQSWQRWELILVDDGSPRRGPS